MKLPKSVLGATTNFLLIALLVIAGGGALLVSQIEEPGAESAKSSSVNNKLAGAPSRLNHIWPPRVGSSFPDLELYTNRGGKLRLSDLKGKVLIVEPVGMTCPACNAFNGAHKVGGFGGIKPQRGVSDLEHMLRQWGETDISDPRLIVVQLILYNMKMKAPSPDDARAWAKHFGWNDHENVYVMAGDERYINRASYNMIPGFYLIDKDFILRSDSTGHHPKNGLGSHLLPMVPKLLDQVSL